MCSFETYPFFLTISLGVYYFLKPLNYAFNNAEFAKEFNQRKPTTDHWMDFSIESVQEFICSQGRHWIINGYEFGVERTSRTKSQLHSGGKECGS